MPNGTLYVAELSKLVRAYFEKTGFKTFGTLVCDEFTEGMIDSLKEVDVGIVYLKRNALKSF